ncbi:MAG: hypothetical protein ACE5EE_09105 [Fidelibacterota bacterium]
MLKNLLPALGLLRKTVIFSTLLVLIPFFVATVSSDSMAQSGTGIIRVAPTGSDTPGCGSVGSPCATLQFAVNEIPVGGTTTIQVAAGTYVSTVGNEVVEIVGRNITMEGGYTTAFTAADPVTNVTIIDGQNARRGITTRPAEGPIDPILILSGVTLTNGNAPTDTSSLSSFGGALNSFSSTVTLSNVKVTNNIARGLDSSSGIPGAGAGGGLSFRQSDATLSNVVLTGNTAQGGDGTGSAPRGGLAVGGGFFAFESTTSIVDLTASNNLAQAGDAPGSFGTDDGAEFTQRADALGGGLNFTFSTVFINSSTVKDNIAQGGDAAELAGGGDGGGIYIERAPETAIILSSTITDNTAQGGIASGLRGGEGLGGGVFVSASDADCDELTILNNNAIGATGGTEGGSAGGGGLYFSPLFDLSARFNLNGTNMIVGNNTATAGPGATNGLSIGGGLHFSHSSDVILNHVTLARNVVRNGEFNFGEAMFVQNEAILTSNFAIIADHLSAPAVSANPTGIATLNRTLWDNNILKFSGNVIDNDPQSGSPDFVNPAPPDSSTDFYNPEFVAQADSLPDFHIKESSAARDNAIGSTTPIDIDGQSRPFGSVADLGADEFAPPLSLDITANDLDGPVTLDTGTLSVKVGLTSGINGDWWVAANVSGTSTLDGWYYYKLLGTPTPGFVFAGPSPFDIDVTFQGPLSNITPPFEVLKIGVPPPGTYTFYFAVDPNVNGILEIDDKLTFDLVKVVVP